MKNSINRLLSWPAFYPISLVALIAVFFLESFFRDSIFLPYPHMEFTSQWYPYLIYNSSMWKAGEVPLWSHNLLAGFPLAAFPHAAATANTHGPMINRSGFPAEKRFILSRSILPLHHNRKAGLM
jgi:hypothetical protein